MEILEPHPPLMEIKLIRKINLRPSPLDSYLKASLSVCWLVEMRDRSPLLLVPTHTFMSYLTGNTSGGQTGSFHLMAISGKNDRQRPLWAINTPISRPTPYNPPPDKASKLIMPENFFLCFGSKITKVCVY